MQNNYCFGRWMIYFYGIGSSEIAALMAEDLFYMLVRLAKLLMIHIYKKYSLQYWGTKDIIVTISLNGSSSELYQACKLQKKMVPQLLLNYLIVSCKLKGLKV